MKWNNKKIFMNDKCAKIEAILFACGDPVDKEKLADFLKISKKEMEAEIATLKEFYIDNKNGLQIVSKGNTIQLVSSSRFGKFVASFLDKNVNEPLTNAALEVLSIIAYRGPITRSQVDYIRGVNCSFMIRNLAIRGLIEKVENLANTRSYEYVVSYDFLKSMGIERIEQLADYELLNKTEIGQGMKDSVDEISGNKEGKNKEAK